MARITGNIPSAVWGPTAARGDRTRCALCGQGQCDLVHLLAVCPAVASCRPTEAGGRVGMRLVRWVLAESPEMADLRAKVRYLGLVVSAFVHARLGGPLLSDEAKAQPPFGGWP